MFKKNKPGPVQVGAITKAQKKQKHFEVSKYTLLQHTKFFWKSLAMPKKLEGGTFSDFLTSNLSQTSEVIEGGNFFPKKSRNAERNLKGGPFGLVR